MQTAPATTLARRLRQEEGVVIPVIMLVLAVALLVVAVAATSAGFSSDASNRDRSSKRALQAADAGVDVAIYRMNKLDLTHQTPLLQCVQVNVSGVVSLTAAVGGWCPAVTESLGSGASYSYQVKLAAQVPGQQTLQWTIVSTGIVCPAATTPCPSPVVNRRVAVTATALTGAPLFGANAVISLLDLNMTNNSQITGNAASNGNIILDKNSQICGPGGVGGNATPGPGKSVTLTNNAKVCGSKTPATSPIVLSPVNQGNAAQVNDDGRICAVGGDPCTRASDISWNPTTRRLSLANNSTLTLGGSIYSFCQLDLKNNAQLIIPPKAAGSSVRIYIDSPENCTNNPVGLPVGGFTKQNNAILDNSVNADPSTLQLYVVGSPTKATTISLINNGNNRMTLYAPNSTVTMDNNAQITGAVAAKQISLENNNVITYATSVGGLTTTGVFPLFQRQGYHECTPVAPAGSTHPQDDGC